MPPNNNDDENEMSKNTDATVRLMVHVAELRTELRKGVVKELGRITESVDGWGEKLGEISTRVTLMEGSLSSIKKTVDKWGEYKQVVDKEGVRGRWMIFVVVIAGVFSITAAMIALLK